ncbi:MAG: hypothetical protein GX134_07585 [candidate division WS1 bacterium]|jgi:hypothetical protein|nr:hypothetical protein [candidate division WS1 bacterium]
MRWKMAVLVAVLASVAVMPGTTGCEVVGGGDIIAHVTWVAEVYDAPDGQNLFPAVGAPCVIEACRMTGGKEVSSTLVRSSVPTDEAGTARLTQHERISTEDVLSGTVAVATHLGGMSVKTETVSHAMAEAFAGGKEDAYMQITIRAYRGYRED